MHVSRSPSSPDGPRTPLFLYTCTTNDGILACLHRTKPIGPRPPRAAHRVTSPSVRTVRAILTEGEVGGGTGRRPLEPNVFPFLEIHARGGGPPEIELRGRTPAIGGAIRGAREERPSFSYGMVFPSLYRLVHLAGLARGMRAICAHLLTHLSLFLPAYY